MGWSTILNLDSPTITYSLITFIPFISIVYLCVHDSHKYSYKLPLLNYYYLYHTSIIYIYIYIIFISYKLLFIYIYIYTIYLWWFQLLSRQAISAASLGAGSVGTGSAGGAESASPETSPGKAKETRTGSCWGGWEKWDVTRLWMVDVNLYIYIYIYISIYISIYIYIYLYIYIAIYIYEWECWDIPFRSSIFFDGIWEYENGGFGSTTNNNWVRMGYWLCLGWT